MPSAYLRKIGRLFSMQLSSAVQYRADLILWTLSDTLTPLVALAIWYTVASSKPEIFSAQEVLTYYVMVMFITFFTTAWNGHFFAQEIQDGSLAKYLLQPISYFWKHIVNNIAEKMVKTSLPVILLFLVLILFPKLFSAAIYTPINIVFFIVSLVLAAVVSFTLDMAIGSLAFWLEDAMEIRRYKYLLDTVASGILIPYAFMPHTIQTIFTFLPFRYTVAAPAEVLLGRLSRAETIETIAIQIAWTVSLTLLLYISWKKGLKRYAVPSQ